jgi:2-amino-4-hydroxy-6-hydroxymethyldihydropteridine diphosphokinase
LTAVSAIYETVPLGPAQTDYLNAAVRLSTELTPRVLLERLLEIEKKLGRERRERWGPRLIDLDLLWIDGIAVHEPGLVVPHPGLADRAFALAPLLDVAPNACDPETGEAYGERLEHLGATGIREISGTRSTSWWKS